MVALSVARREIPHVAMVAFQLNSRRLGCKSCVRCRRRGREARRGLAPCSTSRTLAPPLDWSRFEWSRVLGALDRPCARLPAFGRFPRTSRSHSSGASRWDSGRRFEAAPGGSQRTVRESPDQIAVVTHHNQIRDRDLAGVVVRIQVRLLQGHRLDSWVRRDAGGLNPSRGANRGAATSRDARDADARGIDATGQQIAAGCVAGEQCVDDERQIADAYDCICRVQWKHSRRRQSIRARAQG